MLCQDITINALIRLNKILSTVKIWKSWKSQKRSFTLSTEPADSIFEQRSWLRRKHIETTTSQHLSGNVHVLEWFKAIVEWYQKEMIFLHLLSSYSLSIYTAFDLSGDQDQSHCWVALAKSSSKHLCITHSKVRLGSKNEYFLYSLINSEFGMRRIQLFFENNFLWDGFK